MKKILLVALFSLACGFLYAQLPQKPASNLKIKGKVRDSVSRQPLQFATITLFRPGEKKSVNGGISDNKGKFVVSSVLPGTYRLVAEFIGYRPYILNNLVIRKTDPVLDLPEISLAPKVTTLQNINISVGQKLVENKIDKLVYNAERDLTSQTGVATDVLKKVPEVSVDVDGNVELAGSSSIRFLINGKPSSAFGSSPSDVLQSIPASQIKSIEVITNPGAKYDAQGLGGIINIVLKKDNSQGVNGNLSLTAGTRMENGSFNFNARKNNFGVNAYISGNGRLTATTPSNSDRLTNDTLAKENILLHQDGSSDFHRQGYQSGINLDWDIDKRNDLFGSISYDNFSNIGNSYTSQVQTFVADTGGVLSSASSQLNNYHSFHFHNTDASISYKRTFAKDDQELDISANTSHGNQGSVNNNYQYDLPSNLLYYSTLNFNPGTEDETEIRVDYTQPIQEKVVLGMGGKVTFNNITSNSNVDALDSSSGQYIKNNFLSEHLSYHQKVYAGYAEISFPVFKWFDAKLGGRYERTDIQSFYSNAQQQTTTPGYNTVVPSVFFSRKLNDKERLQLSFSKRIERPNYWDLNPFINTSDPKNFNTGNPNLKPEIGLRYELGYTRTISGVGMVMFNLFYRISEHDIQPFIVYYPTYQVGDSTYTNVNVSSRENIGRENNIGLNIFGDIHSVPNLNLRTNIFLFKRHTINAIDPGYSYSSFNYHINLNASYQFTHTLLAEVFGNFHSAIHQAQGQYPAWTSYSMAIRKQFWNKKGSLALTASNPFSKYLNRRMVVAGPNFTVNSISRIPIRSIGLNFTWKFGKLEFKDKNQNPGDNNLNPPSDNG